MEVKDGTRDTGPAVEVGSLIKRYGELVAVDGLSLKIPRGQVLGLLGRSEEHTSELQSQR